MWTPIRSSKTIVPWLCVILFLGSLSLSAETLVLRSGNFTIMSDRGDSTLLRNAITLIQNEQPAYRSLFNLQLDQPLDISFYYDPNELGTRLHAVPYWSAGMAKSGAKVLIYGRNRNQWLTTLRHELFHALLGQNQITVPVWLNEGLAQWHAGQLKWGGFLELGAATARGRLIPLVDLDVILSFNHKQASLAYAQALDATQFLIKRQGLSILPFLLVADERSFRERFKAETGESLIDFEIAWREELESRLWFFKISQIPGLLWAISPLIVILAWYLKRRRGKMKMDAWDAEEGQPDEPKYFA